MRTWLILLFSAVFAGCASQATVPQAIPQPMRFFHDAGFTPASEPIDATRIFAVSDEMRHYLNFNIASELRTKGAQRGLFDALYSKHQLKLEYDAEITRNAADTFKVRSGNCLSLVIMTAAFAKEMGLSLQYQSVAVDETWSRRANLYFSAGHVNLVLGKKRFDTGKSYDYYQTLTIDFLPPEEVRGQHVRPIEENTIVAMYMNNRAAELLSSGRLDDAYWWAREALVQNPAYLPSYNMLGVIYWRHHNWAEAEQAFNFALEREPDNLLAMANLVQVLQTMGRVDEANKLRVKLDRMQPYPPFYYFDRGIAAMKNNDYSQARDWFAKEVDRAPYYHEFHFWLAVAYFRLDDVRHARKHMAIAMENSTTRNDQALYAAKLDRLNALTQH
ncbi:tetratricopeptide repeat protein [Undibacterium sp. Jales W-56]|uniref:tetratricopeptide repeat protein n=1 Tax=Undibacterium sp. Jales W-56 TaxID=2897325 RepID=UPI0021D1F440|nr:tetratricopeptide repeat protein [Undibacterium sp. Jales W-56]MCU6435002.1 tetratricopeptide repeat protein [Undibacterium sp. Jales W-56]